MENSSKKIDNILNEAYYKKDSPHGFTTAEKLYRHVKKTHPEITLSYVRKWFTSHPVPSRFRLQRSKFARSIFVTRAKHNQWICDLADFGALKRYNKNRRYLYVLGIMHGVKSRI